MSELKKITDAEVVEAIHAVVAEAGEDHRYSPPDPESENCFYSNADGTPGCIVGHVVARLDPEGFAKIHRFEFPDGVVNEEGLVGGAEELFSEAGATGWNEDYSAKMHEAGFRYEDRWDQVSPAVLSALGSAQVRQDQGQTWGHALKTFDYRLSDLIENQEND